MGLQSAPRPGSNGGLILFTPARAWSLSTGMITAIQAHHNMQMFTLRKLIRRELSYGRLLLVYLSAPHLIARDQQQWILPRRVAEAQLCRGWTAEAMVPATTSMPRT